MNTSKSNTHSVPQAKDAMNKFKYEVANEIGVPLKQGYNGDLTSAQAGYVGGYMVKDICPIRIIKKAKRKVTGEWIAFTYNARIWI